MRCEVYSMQRPQAVGSTVETSCLTKQTPFTEKTYGREPIEHIAGYRRVNCTHTECSRNLIKQGHHLAMPKKIKRHHSLEPRGVIRLLFQGVFQASKAYSSGVGSHPTAIEVINGLRRILRRSDIFPIYNPSHLSVVV